MRVRTKIIAFVLAFVSAFFSMIAGTWSSQAAPGVITHLGETYQVKPGDSLWGIANHTHTTVHSLVTVNHLHTTVLQIHQRISLALPGKPCRGLQGRQSIIEPHRAHVQAFVVTRRVVAGDTLWQLAEANGTTVAHLKEINHLVGDTIYVGQHLRTYVGSKSVWSKRELQAVRKLGVPLSLLPVYQGAAKKYGVPWNVLAAIHHEETDYSTNGYEISPAGAEGPMQFMPSTFAVYGVTAPGQCGLPNIHNVADAIYSCAHMLACDGYSKNPSTAIYQYNHSMDYVDAVQSYAELV